MKPNIAETLDKQKLLDALDEEIFVYETADSKFDEGVLYLAKKLKATIALHVFDAQGSGEVERQAEEIERLQAHIEKIERAGYV
jgi:hypothetical protein